MQTKEQVLESMKSQRCQEIETFFNNMVNSGTTVLFGNDRTESMYVAGGREALFSLKAFLSYYSKKNATEVFVRDPISKKTHYDTLANMATMVSEVEDWGMEAYQKNIKKQDYIKYQCVTIEEVLGVTWDSVEPTEGE